MPTRGKKKAIVSEAEIVLYPERVFYVLVKAIKVDIGKYLRCEVTNRSPFSNCTFYVKAINNVA